MTTKRPLRRPVLRQRAKKVFPNAEAGAAHDSQKLFTQSKLQGSGNIFQRVFKRADRFFSERFLALKGRFVTADRQRRLEVCLAVTPGLFFIAFGFSILFSPTTLPYLVAGFCLSFGIFGCGLGLKLLRLKRKISQVSHQIEARLIIDPGKVTEFSHLETIESKKVVVH